jgi:hypothetical protein
LSASSTRNIKQRRVGQGKHRSVKEDGPAATPRTTLRTDASQVAAGPATVAPRTATGKYLSCYIE